jgi:hypothetical protein
MRRVINAMNENTVDKMAISARETFGLKSDTNRNPPDNKRTYKNKSCKGYL